MQVPRQTDGRIAVSRETMINHLRVQHGYAELEDAEHFRTSGGIAPLDDETLWPLDALYVFHNGDHEQYPDTGTPVTGWAHHHR